MDGLDAYYDGRPLRDSAREIFLAGVRAADPRVSVLETLEIAPSGRPVLAGEELAPDANLRIVSFGKAALSMAEAANEVLAEDVFLEPGIAAVNPENARELPRFRVHVTGHPVPDAAGVTASTDVIRYMKGTRPEDGVLVLISGGGSALLPAPAIGITLEDKMETTRQLLASGADIYELNTVRKHLSSLKGGGLARVAGPARIEALILSDVIGDDLSTIASGPTAPDPTTFEDARRILDLYGLFDQIPVTVRERFESGALGRIDDTPTTGDPIFSRVANRIIGSNGMSLDAAARKALELGFHVEILSRELAGEARAVGAGIAAKIGDFVGVSQPVALLAGGETTVTLRGSGKGGRNQEMAAAVALAATAQPVDHLPWVFLSGGTDGRDGPTVAAGGLVDPGTVRRCHSAGLDFEAELDENNSHVLLDASGDLVITGATGTNVADLQILLIAGE